MRKKRRRNKCRLLLSAGVAHLNRDFLPLLMENAGVRVHTNGPLLTVDVRGSLRVHAAPPPPSPHLHTCDDWHGFRAESYGAVECFIEEVDPAAWRAPFAPSPSHVAHSPRRADVVTFPVCQDGHLWRWCFHHGVRFRTWVLQWG